MTCVSELEEFAATTSVKGVGRAFFSQCLALKVIWKFSVLVFLSIACFHGSSIISEYLNYPTTTTYSSRSLLNSDSISSVFPDITLCNLNPISSVQSHGLDVDVLTIPQYVQLVQQYDDRFITDLEMTISDIFLTTKAYYQNIGFRNSSLIGHTPNDFIASCFVDLFDGFASEFISCQLIISVTWTSYPSLFNCYTLKVRDTNYSSFISGYKLVLHLDNYETDHMKYLTSKYNDPYAYGGVVFPHQPGTKGWMEGNAIFLHPGTHIHLKLGMREIRRLGTPYGSCVETEVVQYNQRWKYTQLSCVNGCVQDEVIKACGCRDVEVMDILANDNYSSIPYCLSFVGNSHSNHTLETLSCALSQRAEKYQSCRKVCPESCYDLEFTWKMSKSDWPTPSLSKRFYAEYIKGRPWESRYETSNLSSHQNSIKDNFLSLDIFKSVDDSTTLYDSPKITEMSFVSELGAALNLWAGISMAVIIEIIEFVIRVVWHGRLSGRHGGPPTAEGAS